MRLIKLHVLKLTDVSFMIKYIKIYLSLQGSVIPEKPIRTNLTIAVYILHY